MGLFSIFQPKNSDASAQKNDAQLFRKSVVRVFAMGGDAQALQSADGELIGLFPAFVVDFLMDCADFKTFGEHLLNYASYHGIGVADANALQGWVPRLQEAGLFISAHELRKKCAAIRDVDNHPAPMSAAGFATGNRVEMVRRAVESFAANVRKFSRDVEFIVADNSAKPETREACKEMLRGLERDYGIRAFHAGDEEKLRFIKAVSKEAACDPEIVKFALFDVENTGFACGANRNALLLHEVGNLFSTIDDDMVCRIAAAQEPKNGVAFFSERDAFERWFFEDRESAMRAATFIDADYFSLHEQMLGQDIGACVARADDVRFIHMTDEILKRLATDRGRVVATFTGHVGDPGVPTSYYYLGYRRDSFRRLTSSESFYRAALASRSVLTLAPENSIADASLSPGMAMGFDQRELLPPFIPVLHAEDFVYGAELWECCPHGFLGHVPFALSHEPAAGKTIIAPGDLNGENRAVIFEFAHILRFLILEYQPHPGLDSTAARMRGLGRHLREIASAKRDDFLEFLRPRILQHESDKIAFFESLLKQREAAPAFWQQDVEAYLDHTREALTHDDFDIPHDLKKLESEKARALMQRLILQFGRLLEAWPDLIEATKRLRDRGERLAARV